MASKFKKFRVSENTKKKVYSLILIILMVTSAIAFIAVYYATDTVSANYKGYNIVQNPNSYGYILLDYNLELVNHPSSLGFDNLNMSEDDTFILVNSIKSSKTIASTYNLTSIDLPFIEEFNFGLTKWSLDIFDGTQFNYGSNDINNVNYINCNENENYNMIFNIQQNNNTYLNLDGKCLNIYYKDSFELNMVLENILLYRIGVLK
ncbi:hypothetical protein HN836_03355 [Candidatus Woesearchaeota archaeon]|nr:hypothetical protein [Candidatus Woesearchaeota archaeon]